MTLPQLRCLRIERCDIETAEISTLCSKATQTCALATEDICPVPAADICPVSTEDIYLVSTEDETAVGRRPAAFMSSVETGLRSSVETGRMSAVEARHLPTPHPAQQLVGPSHGGLPGRGGCGKCLVSTASLCTLNSRHQHQHSSLSISIHPIGSVLTESSLGWASPSQHPNLFEGVC